MEKSVKQSSSESWKRQTCISIQPTLTVPLNCLVCFVCVLFRLNSTLRTEYWAGLWLCRVHIHGVIGCELFPKHSKVSSPHACLERHSERQLIVHHFLFFPQCSFDVLIYLHPFKTLWWKAHRRDRADYERHVYMCVYRSHDALQIMLLLGVDIVVAGNMDRNGPFKRITWPLRQLSSAITLTWTPSFPSLPLIHLCISFCP